MEPFPVFSLYQEAKSLHCYSWARDVATFNSIQFCPAQKVLSGTMESRPHLISKPGKPPNKLTSYRSISLLPIVSKVFEKLLKRLLPMVENNRLISNHQFGFRQGHSTTEQTHRIVQRINEALENMQHF
jgi:hypothetical protein